MCNSIQPGIADSVMKRDYQKQNKIALLNSPARKSKEKKRGTERSTNFCVKNSSMETKTLDYSFVKKEAKHK